MDSCSCGGIRSPYAEDHKGACSDWNAYAKKLVDPEFKPQDISEVILSLRRNFKKGWFYYGIDEGGAKYSQYQPMSKETMDLFDAFGMKIREADGLICKCDEPKLDFPHLTPFQCRRN